MYHSPEELLPYRCPSCGSEKRFRSLIALRLHMSILHDSVPTVVSHRRSESVIQPWSKDGQQLDDQTNILDNWEKILDSTRSVEEMYDKYSMKIDNVLGKYDKEAKHLEGKLRLAQQIEELKKQKEQLHRIKSNWKTVHGISQLVKDTDEVIKRSIDPLTMAKIQTEKSTNNSNNKSVPNIQSKNEVVIAKHNPADKLDLSVQLAAQYKALAITTEEKLNEKMKDEEHLRKYIEATALKEVKAKKKLSEFMENLLTRAEQAEFQLQLYQDNAGLSSTAKSNSVGSRLNNSRLKISRNDHKRNRSEKIPQSFLPHESQLNDSGIQLNSSGEQQSKKSGLGRRPSNDAYVNEILERPISGQVQRTGNQGLLDVKSLMPFSNVANKNSDMAADRRVALFCVFAQLRSIDLLRCGMVCREWRETARHPQLWSRIHFHDVRTDAKLFGLISKWSSDTCYFSLSNIQTPHKGQSLGTGYLEEGLEMILKSCADKLLVISLDQCDEVLTSRVLFLVSCYNKNIRSVTYKSAADPLGHQVAWALGSSCRNIVSLEVAPLQPCLVRGLFDNGVARLLSWCWPQLQALSFGGADIDGAGLLAVALNCQHLKVLELFHARGVAEDNAKSVCKHGLKELHTLIFTHTPVQAATLLCFLQTLNLHSLHVELTQRDFFTKSKYRKFQPEYAKISKALKAVQKNLKYKDVLDITWS